MENILLLNKPVGKTPLEVIQEYQEKNPAYQKVKLGYAGRLDPMAEGLLLVLIGEENKKKYQDLDKEYEFEVLFGVETDTYDILGLVSSGVIPDPLRLVFSEASLIRNLPREILSRSEVLRSHGLKQVQDEIGEKEQPYPPYSSKAVNGKPLHFWARENRLDEIKIPSRKITIYSIKVLKNREIDQKDLRKYILNRVNLVKGDFRQEEILKSWNNFFNQNSNRTFLVLKFLVRCSSGTYVRSIAHEMGKKLGVGAIAFSIKRTKVGDYSIGS